MDLRELSKNKKLMIPLGITTFLSVASYFIDTSIKNVKLEDIHFSHNNNGTQVYESDGILNRFTLYRSEDGKINVSQRSLTFGFDKNYIDKDGIPGLDFVRIQSQVYGPGTPEYQTGAIEFTQILEKFKPKFQEFTSGYKNLIDVKFG